MKESKTIPSISKLMRKILVKMSVQSITELTRFTSQELCKLADLDVATFLRIQSELLKHGVRLLDETEHVIRLRDETVTESEHLDCRPVCGYEVVWEKAIAKVGEVTRIAARCSPGKYVLGGGFNIISPLWTAERSERSEPHYVILQSGPAIQEVESASTGWRHVRALGWDVEIFIQSYHPSPNYPDGPEVYVYAIAANAEEATSGAGYYKYVVANEGNDRIKVNKGNNSN